MPQPLPTATTAPPAAQTPRAWSDRVLARLSRVTSGGRFIPEIDGLRFLAIATVVMHHLATQVERQVYDKRLGINPASITDPVWTLVHHGAVGVQVFFAISGFILAMPFAKAALDNGHPVRLKEYFWRRLTRLEPPFVLSLLLLYAAWVYVVPALGMNAENKPTPSNLWYSLLYAHYARYGEPSLVNGVTWSLEIEVQFYILMPLFALLYRVQDTVTRRLLMVAIMACTAVVKGVMDTPLQQVHLSLSLLGYLHCFFVGLLMADIYIVSWKQRPAGGSWAWDAAGLLGMAAIIPQGAGGPAQLWRIALFLPGMVLVFAAAFRGRLVRAFFANRWIATIGGMCYSIYLLHYAVLFAAMILALKAADRLAPKLGANWYVIAGGNPTLNLLLWAVVLVPVVLVVSSFFFAWIERPCMNKHWPRALWGRLTGKGALSETR